MTDPRGACAQPAGTLAPGVPCVRGWAQGRRAAETLAEQLVVAEWRTASRPFVQTSTSWATA